MGTSEYRRIPRQQPPQLPLLPVVDGGVPWDCGPWLRPRPLQRGAAVAAGRSGPLPLPPSWPPGCRLRLTVRKRGLRSQRSGSHNHSSLDRLDCRLQHDFIDLAGINLDEQLFSFPRVALPFSLVSLAKTLRLRILITYIRYSSLLAFALNLQSQINFGVSRRCRCCCSF